MKNLIKRYWDIFGGAFCGLGLSYMVSWKLTEIQLIYSIIILILVCIGLFKVLKTSIDKQLTKRKIILDKLVDSQKPMRAIHIANNPTKTGEELAEVLIDTMKGGKKLMEKIKNFFIWIKNYWQQILGYIGSLGTYALYLYALINDKLGFILKMLPDGEEWQLYGKIGFGILASLILILSLRNQGKWVGFGSIAQAKEYIENKTKKIESSLSSEAKNNVKKTVKNYKLELKKVEKSISSFESEIKTIENSIKSCSELLKIGLGNQLEYNELISKKQKLQSDLKDAQSQKEQLTSDIEKYQQVL